MDIGALHKHIEAVAPIDGVSPGTTDDRTLWRIDFKPEATPEQRQAARDAMMAWVEPPPKAPPLSFYEFIGLLTASERQAVLAAAVANPSVLEVVLVAAGNAEGLYLSDPRVIAGLDLVEAEGCITASRKSRILSGLPPE